MKDVDNAIDKLKLGGGGRLKLIFNSGIWKRTPVIIAKVG